MKRKSPKNSKNKPSPGRTETNSSREVQSKATNSLAAKALASQLTDVPITEVAKIAALMSPEQLSPRESVERAYALLEQSAIARDRILKGSGHSSIRGCPSDLRWQTLKAAFPQISRNPDEPPCLVSFEDGLARLMGPNTKIPDRPEILARFLQTECHAFAGSRRLTPQEARYWIEFFRSNDFSANIYSDLWFAYPRWRENDIKVQRSLNAKKNIEKKARGARPPQTDEIQREKLALLKLAAYDTKNS